MSEKSLENEQGVLTESVIVDSGVIGVGEGVHPITSDELSDAFMETFDADESEEEHNAHVEDVSWMIDVLDGGGHLFDDDFEPKKKGGDEIAAAPTEDQEVSADDAEDSDEPCEAFNKALDSALMECSDDYKIFVLGMDEMFHKGDASKPQDGQPKEDQAGGGDDAQQSGEQDGQEAQQPQEPQMPERPKLDRDAMKQYILTHQAEMRGTNQLASKGSGDNGTVDVVQAQETMKDIENGDTYTDDAGKKWNYTVFEFSVVPEDVKDEEADDIGAEEPDVDNVQGAQDAAPTQYTEPVMPTVKRSRPDINAKIKAAKTHRRNVAATWEDCKAKEKAKCPYHGAAYMTDQIKGILAKSGYPIGKFAVVQVDPEIQVDKGDPKLKLYKLVYSLPEGTPPDVAAKITKDFFASMPNVDFKDYNQIGENPNDKLFQLNEDFEDAGDIPLDAPTDEEENALRDTDDEDTRRMRTYQRSSASGYDDQAMMQFQFLDMLAQKPNNIVALNDDMMRYASQFPEALPEGMSVDQVRAAYDKFKKANDLHKGLSAFILNGEVVPEADALAEAATAGKEKQAKAYREAAGEVYDMASKVFNGVRSAISDKLHSLSEGYAGIKASARAVNGYGGKALHDTAYLGKAFRSSTGRFPANQSGEGWDELRRLMKSYELAYGRIKNLTEFQKGCEQKEPMRAYFGLELCEANIRHVKEIGDKIGELQDRFLTGKGEEWAKKHGYMPKKQTPSETPAEEPKKEERKVAARKTGTDEVKAEEAKQTAKKTEKKTEKKAKQKKLEAKPVAPESTEKKESVEKKGTEEKKKAAAKKNEQQNEAAESKPAQAQQKSDITPEMKAAAQNDPTLNDLNNRMQEAWKRYGPNSPEYKLHRERAEEAFKAFFDRERAKAAAAKNETQSAETNEQPRSEAKKPATQRKKSPGNAEQKRRATYEKQFAEMSERVGKTKSGKTIAEMFEGGYGVYKNGNGEMFFAQKAQDGKVDSSKPFYRLDRLHASIGGGMDFKDFVGMMQNQERLVGEKQQKDREEQDWYNTLFGAS